MKKYISNIKSLTFLLLIWLNFTAAKPVDYGHIKGLVSDAQTGLSVAWVDIYIKELNRSASTLENGRFVFIDIPPGEYTIEFMRIGYIDVHQHIHVSAKDTNLLNIDISPNSYDSETIVVEDHRDHSHLQRPDVEMSGKDMRRKLATTLAETIKDIPGMAEQTNGPAPARPVLRGLSGDRLLLLENGKRTGDLSTTSADHAVTIEPITAERVEVIRGPMTLMYGSNTLSGVINVVRNSEKSPKNPRIKGAFSNSYESVNSGYASALNIEIPLNQFFFYGDGSFRSASDINIPGGKLKNTFLETLNGKTEFRWYPAWGVIRTEAGLYNSAYGIPPAPSFLGHPNGVDIELQKTFYKTGIKIKKPLPLITSLDLDYDFTNYFHEEFASSGFRDAAFSLFSQHFTAQLAFTDFSVFSNIRAGLWYENRDFEAGGLTNTVNSTENSIAGWFYLENDFGRFKTSSALRLEKKTITPAEEKTDLRVGKIQKRSFTDYAASIKMQYGLSSNLIFSSTLLRAFRAPGIEELFADGPHLPSYAYEVGNAALDQEITYGIESGLEYESNNLNLNALVYYNRIDGYLFSQNTGQRSWKRNDLFRYQMVGLDAVIKGVELSSSYKFRSNFSILAGLSFLNGDLRETMVYTETTDSQNSEIIPSKVKADEPLPFMPPLKAHFDLHYDIGKFSFVYSGQIAGKQSRPGRFESSTPGYIVHSLSAEYFIASSSLLHTLSLNIANLTDITHRRHLNRIKEIFPEPGRNIRFLYKLYF